MIIKSISPNYSHSDVQPTRYCPWRAVSLRASIGPTHRAACDELQNRQPGGGECDGAKGVGHAGAARVPTSRNKSAARSLLEQSAIATPRADIWAPSSNPEPVPQSFCMLPYVVAAPSKAAQDGRSITTGSNIWLRLSRVLQGLLQLGNLVFQNRLCFLSSRARPWLSSGIPGARSPWRAPGASLTSVFWASVNAGLLGASNMCRQHSALHASILGISS